MRGANKDGILELIQRNLPEPAAPADEPSPPTSVPATQPSKQEANTEPEETVNLPPVETKSSTQQSAKSDNDDDKSEGENKCTCVVI